MNEISHFDYSRETYLVILSGFVWFLALTDACKKSGPSTVRLLQLYCPDKSRAARRLLSEVVQRLRV